MSVMSQSQEDIALEFHRSHVSAQTGAQGAQKHIAISPFKNDASLPFRFQSA